MRHTREQRVVAHDLQRASVLPPQRLVPQPRRLVPEMCAQGLLSEHGALRGQRTGLRSCAGGAGSIRAAVQQQPGAQHSGQQQRHAVRTAVLASTRCRALPRSRRSMALRFSRQPACGNRREAPPRRPRGPRPARKDCGGLGRTSQTEPNEVLRFTRLHTLVK